MPSSTLSLALVLAVLLVASVAASSTCVTRVQCSNHGNCVNGSCQCDTGFAGTTCQYCVAAGVCGHGQVRGGQPSISSLQHLTSVLRDNKQCVNGACQCNTGYWHHTHTHTHLQPYLTPPHRWTGPNCTLPACSLDCQHGGQANPQCNYCFNCLGAWQGPTCSTYNASAAASGIYKPLFASLTTAARVHVAAAPSTSPYPPIPGWRWLGFSYDITKLQHSQIPALALNFTSPAHHWVSGNNTVFGLPGTAAHVL